MSIIICLIVIVLNVRFKFLFIDLCKNRNIISFFDFINSFDRYVFIGLSKYYKN